MLVFYAGLWSLAFGYCVAFVVVVADVVVDVVDVAVGVVSVVLSLLFVLFQ